MKQLFRRAALSFIGFASVLLSSRQSHAQEDPKPMFTLCFLQDAGLALIVGERVGLHGSASFVPPSLGGSLELCLVRETSANMPSRIGLDYVRARTSRDGQELSLTTVTTRVQATFHQSWDGGIYFRHGVLSGDGAAETLVGQSYVLGLLAEYHGDYESKVKHPFTNGGLYLRVETGAGYEHPRSVVLEIFLAVGVRISSF